MEEIIVDPISPVPPAVNPPLNTPPIPESPEYQGNSIKLVEGLFVAILVGLVGFWYFARINQQMPLTPPVESSPIPSLKPVEVTLNTDFDESFIVAGFALGIPRGWNVSISSKTTSVLAARLYPPGVVKSTTYLDVQVGPTSEFAPNPMLSLDPPTNERDLTLRTGKENILESKRLVFQVEKTKGNNKALLTFYGDQSKINELRTTIKEILGNNSPTSYSPSWSLVGKVKAEEVATTSATPPLIIAGFDSKVWKEVQVMEGPYPERLSETDKAYKDGYARLYTFSVIPGQRVEVLAEEGKETMAKSGSFIESELYDSKGNLITKGGTRIALSEYDKLLTGGRYYLIVNSYPGKKGEFLLKVFDLDQVQDLYYAHYADGSELLINNPGKNQISKNQSAVMIVHFTSPIEIVGDNKVRYFREKDNGCIACNSYVFGDITIPYIFKVNNIETPIKITKIFLNQALIQPATGEGFPANSQISFEIDYGEDPSTPGVRSGYTGGFRTY